MGSLICSELEFLHTERPNEEKLFAESAMNSHKQFRNKTAFSRSMSEDKMEEYAQGRVWTGNDAASRGLVDAIGGFSRAIAIAKQKANIHQDKQVSELKQMMLPEGRDDPVRPLFLMFFDHLQKMMLQYGAISTTPTKVLSLTQAVAEKDLVNDEDYEDILEDIKTECGQFRALVNVIIPRPNPNGDQVSGLERFFWSMQTLKVQQNLVCGRKFNGNHVVLSFYAENKFKQGGYNG